MTGAPPGRAAPSVIVVMGPAGAGKSTVGRALAESLGWRFHDADAFHAAASVERMRRGEPLLDADRAPWLAALRALIASELGAAARDAVGGAGAVLACSALSRAHRAALLPPEAPAGAVRFAYLRATPATLRARLEHRPGHFAPAALLASQLATLEEPDAAEDAIVVDGERPVGEAVAMLARALLPGR
jgi:gluconokinase